MKTFKQYLELHDFNANHLYNWLERGKLSFDNIFGQDYRVVIPVVPTYLLNLKEKLEDLSDNETKIKVDLKNATVEIQGTSGQGKPFTRTQRLGAYIQKQFGEKAKVEFDRNYKSVGDNSDYFIILSRHPIDVAKMSDTGRLHSCHAQGREYFQCAMTEAQGHGPVAFLINRDSLERVKDLIPTKEEIFEDSDRDIDGIDPLARIRTRKFISKDYELAIPEIREYGDKIAGFYDSLKEFLISKQKPLFNNEIPEMNDFTRDGGSYEDNASSKLWNKFFDTDEFSGTVRYSGQDDYSSLSNQYRQEAKEYLSKYKFDPKQIKIYWDLLDDHDVEPQIMWGGKAFFYYPKNLLTKQFYEDFGLDPKSTSPQELHSYDEKNEEMKNLIDEINGVLDDSVNLEQLTINVDFNQLVLTLPFENDYGIFSGHPDDFNDFLSSIYYGSLRNEYEEVHDKILDVFMDLKYTTSPLEDKFLNTFNKPFKHLEFYPRANNILIQSETFAITPKIEAMSAQNFYLNMAAYESIKKLIEKVLDNAYDNLLRNYLGRPLPGISRELSDQDFDLAGEKIDIEVDKRKAQITATILWEWTKEELDQPFRKLYLYYIDNNFNSIYQQIISKVPMILAPHFQSQYKNVKIPIKQDQNIVKPQQ